jgi:hypothetical protein
VATTRTGRTAPVRSSPGQHDHERLHLRAVDLLGQHMRVGGDEHAVADREAGAAEHEGGLRVRW